MTQANLERIKEFAARAFQVAVDQILAKAAYNAAPTEPLPVILKPAGHARAAMMSWGVKPGPHGPFVTNARDDSLLVKPMFKQSAQKRRCVILADGFYEWQTIGRTKVPHYFFLKGHEPFALAGLYEPPANPEGPSRCMVVTTTPNAMLEPFHDRMPVILAPEVRQAWLSDQPLTAENLPGFCRPYPVELMQEHRTDAKMSSSRYKEADALAPWKPDPGELLLPDQ